MMFFRKIKEVFKKAISASEEFDKIYKSSSDLNLIECVPLRNCPFCDGSPQIKRYSTYSQFFQKVLTGYYIKCPTCGARTDLELNASTVISKWNRRCHHGNGNMSEL